MSYTEEVHAWREERERKLKLRWQMRDEILANPEKADVNKRTADGETALMLVAQSGSPQMITALLKAGADIEARSEDGKTALVFAAKCSKNPEVILALLEGGADGSATDDDGMTAFDYAKENQAIKGTDAYWKLKEAQY